MKTSFITTVLNEQKSIKDFLLSVFNQTQKPDEIIIIDAGSQDQTINLIKKLKTKTTIPIKLIIKPQMPRSTARNLAVKKARHQIICTSDAGCVLNKNWLKLITRPFKNQLVESVAGFYQIKAQNLFQKAMAPFIAVMPDQFDPKIYLPSSRSLSFRKKAFIKAGQYPEPLNTCEDLIFAANLKHQTNLKIVPQAIVLWQMPSSLSRFFQTIKNYAQGDVQARYKPHLIKIISVYLRYLIFLFFPFLLIPYIIWPIIRYYFYLNHPLAFIYFPFLQFTKDLAMITGSIKGKITLCL